jgi:hypothetical protein
MLKFAEHLSNIHSEKVEVYLLSNTARKPIFSAWGFFEVNIAHYFMVEPNGIIEFFNLSLMVFILISRPSPQLSIC